MRHVIKCRSDEFRAMVEGVKNFEYRVDDRGYQVGDELVLNEINKDMTYTGYLFICKIMYILRGPEFGLPENHCIMSIYGGFLVTP